MKSSTLFNFVLLVAASTFLFSQVLGASHGFELRPRGKKHGGGGGDGDGGSKGKNDSGDGSGGGEVTCHPLDHFVGMYYSYPNTQTIVPLVVQDGYLVESKKPARARSAPCDSTYMGHGDDGAGHFNVENGCITVNTDNGDVTVDTCATADDASQIPQFFGVAHDSAGPYANFLGGPSGQEDPRGFDVKEGKIVAVQGAGSVLLVTGPAGGSGSKRRAVRSSK